MKLNEIMKIKRKITDDSEVTIGAIAPINYGFNLCLDEIGAMNLRVDEEQIRDVVYNVKFVANSHRDKIIKAIIASLPTILTIEADDKREGISV